MVYGSQRLIKAHQERNIPYYNHSYDREVREVICSGCGKSIGEQVRYTDLEIRFRFGNEKDNYTHCPYCGHKFKK